MLDHRAGELITRLRELSSRQTVVLLDYSTDADVTDLSTPLSHATLVAQRVQQLLPSRARARQGALACRFRAGLGIGSAVETIPVAGQRNLAVVLLIIGKIAEALSDMLDCFPEGKAEVFPERLECLDPRALKGGNRYASSADHWQESPPRRGYWLSAAISVLPSGVYARPATPREPGSVSATAMRPVTGLQRNMSPELDPSAVASVIPTGLNTA